MIRPPGKIKFALLARLGAMAFLAFMASLASPTSASSAKKLNVVVSIRPLHSLVAGVMKGAGQPQLLVDGGTPHNFSLKPSNARALQRADIVFWVGPSLEQFLVSPLKTLARKAQTISFEKNRYLSLHTVRSSHQNQSHGHSSQTIDPHIWLDPLNAREMIKQIAKTLGKADPARKDIYELNSRAMIKRLEALTPQIQEKLTPVRGTLYVTLHDAFLYFEKRFRLSYAGSIALTPDHPPGARHLRELRQRIKNQKISCVFSEPQARSKLVKLLIEGSNAKTASLDALGNNQKKGPELYFTLLQNNARAFLSCLRP
ncbi:MAG: zinc ABC transporter substrate-binding protein [Hyphomicrobiaceae bacterium]|nr:zinc ABC transporter substrate-binding protein [Hyphomicrobiaceae bacterium]